MSGVRIIGTGSYLPERVVSNNTIARVVRKSGGGETGDSWITPRTGIKERRFVRKGELCSDLAFRAAEQAIRQAGITAGDLDCIKVATITPDANLPFVSAALQEKLGISGGHAPISDLNAACSGFIYGLQSMVAEMLWCEYRYGLLVGAEAMSRYGVDPKNRNTAIVFGDGAGAVILERTGDNSSGILRTILHGDAIAGRAFDWPRNHGLSMKGQDVFKLAVRLMTGISKKILEVEGYKVSDIDLFVPHQANDRIISTVAEYLEVPTEKVVKTISEHGNTSAASIPLALDVAVRQRRLREGMLVLLVAVGGGLTWGAALIRW